MFIAENVACAMQSATVHTIHHFLFCDQWSEICMKIWKKESRPLEPPPGGVGGGVEKGTPSPPTPHPPSGFFGEPSFWLVLTLGPSAMVQIPTPPPSFRDRNHACRPVRRVTGGWGLRRVTVSILSCQDPNGRLCDPGVLMVEVVMPEPPKTSPHPWGERECKTHNLKSWVG